MAPNHAFLDSIRDRIGSVTGLPPEAGSEEVTVQLHRALAGAPSRILAATLEDALGVTRRPNLPGTTEDRRANWSAALPVPLEDIETHPGPARIASILGR